MRTAPLLAPLLFGLSLWANAAEPLRIAHLARCGDLLARDTQTFCLNVRGLEHSPPKVLLDGQALPARAVSRDGDRLTIEISSTRQRSAPLWLEQNGSLSNPVWLSLAGSHVLAAGPSEVAKNMDGLTTYVDLVSLIIEEDSEGAVVAQQLADKYGAKVVGAIAPLNTYQLRLPARNLMERDALVLRLGSEVGVDAVVIEESSAEEMKSPPRMSACVPMAMNGRPTAFSMRSITTSGASRPRTHRSPPRPCALA